MHPSWKETSEIAQILESQRTLRTRGLTASSDGSSNATAQVGNIDSAIADLHRSQERLQHIPEFYDTITELIGFVKQVRSEVPFQPKVAFSRLQSLRAWIFWLPTDYFEAEKVIWARLLFCRISTRPHLSWNLSFLVLEARTLVA